MADAARALDGLAKVKAKINYAGPMAEEPYMYYRDPPPGEPYTNIVDEAHDVEIMDVRARLDALSLEDDGILFFKHDHDFADFDEDDQIRSTYYRQVEKMVREMLGVDLAVAYDFSVRRPLHGPARPDGIPVAGTRRRPIKRAHGDFVTKSFETFRARHGEQLGVDLSAKRCRVFNFWRAIRGPLTDSPLALCHPASVVPEDMVPMKQFNQPQDNYIAALRYSPDHRWCYLSGMMAEEGVIFSSFDTAHPQARGVVAHSAFDDPTRPPDGLPRDSMEVRVLAVGG